MARARLVRRLAAAFFFLFLLALTWPGVLLVNRVRPLVLGLPFNLFWTAAWVAAGALVLAAVYRTETRAGGG